MDSFLSQVNVTEIDPLSFHFSSDILKKYERFFLLWDAMESYILILVDLAKDIAKHTQEYSLNLIFFRDLRSLVYCRGFGDLVLWRYRGLRVYEQGGHVINPSILVVNT